MSDPNVRINSGSGSSQKSPDRDHQDASVAAADGIPRHLGRNTMRRKLCAVGVTGVLLGAILSVVVGVFIFLRLHRQSMPSLPQQQPEENVSAEASSPGCSTADCRFINEWFSVAFNRSVRPCEDFYAFVCGSFRHGENPFDSIASSMGSIISKSFHSTDVPKKGQTAWHKAAGLFQSCLALANDRTDQISDLRAWMMSLNLDLANLIGDYEFDAADAITTVSLEHNIPAVFEFKISKTNFVDNKREITLLLENPEKDPDEDYYDDYDESDIFRSDMDCDVPCISLHLQAYGISSETSQQLGLSLYSYIVSTQKILKRRTKKKGSVRHRIKNLGNMTSSIASSDEWVAAFKNHTDDMYGPNDSITVLRNAYAVAVDIAGSADVGKRGLRHVLAWRLLYGLFEYVSGANMSCAKGCDKACASLTLASMDVAVMQHYQEIVVAGGVIEKARSMVQNVRTAFEAMLRQSSWLTGEPREVALRKLGKMRYTVGHTDNLPNASAVEAIYESVGDVGDRFFLNWLRARRANVLRLLRDQQSLFTHSLVVNAYYYPHRNEIVILPAAIQPMLFFPHGPASVNYGALGATVGHEIMHGFDVNGVQVDDEGRERNWGTNETTRHYVENALCIRKTHETVDSQRRQLDAELDSENLADFVGLVAAYAAFNALPEGQRDVMPAADNDFGMSPDKAFFVSYCASNCETGTSNMKGYATGRGRCLVPVMNHPAFATTFNCSLGEPMNPPIKCSFF